MNAIKRNLDIYLNECSRRGIMPHYPIKSFSGNASRLQFRAIQRDLRRMRAANDSFYDSLITLNRKFAKFHLHNLINQNSHNSVVRLNKTEANK